MKYFNFIAAILLTILYALGKIPPSENYNLWLAPFIIPFALAANIILLIASLLLRKKSSLYYIVTLVVGSNYLISSFGIRHIFQNDKIKGETFRVLNYNINGAIGRKYSSANTTTTVPLQEWMIDQQSEIQCYQEFNNYSERKKGDFVEKFQDKGFNTYFSYDTTKQNQFGAVGTLIASKFPIIKSGDVISSENGFNRITYADVKINLDTLRIINVHLESMGLKRFNPVYTPGFQARKENTKIILSKLKEGAFERSKQIKILAEFVETSKHPVICAGDFNELPYSYSYQYIKRRMRNTFEQVGKGFGFTYNGNTLRVLRIDNQFYSTVIKAVRF